MNILNFLALRGRMQVFDNIPWPKLSQFGQGILQVSWGGQSRDKSWGDVMKETHTEQR